jgi:hypothetical protein
MCVRFPSIAILTSTALPFRADLDIASSVCESVIRLWLTETFSRVTTSSRLRASRSCALVKREEGAVAQKQRQFHFAHEVDQWC